LTFAKETDAVAADVIPLGARLRQRREELGLTQAQVARELDVARTAYRLWEMEAARPAPDRWRAIAKWLGISVTAMLVAGELLEEQEALGADRTHHGAALSDTWDERSGRSEGDFFSQERAMIADQAEAGTISADQAASLRSVLARIQHVSSDSPLAQWQPGHFRKRLPNTDLTPTLARGALAATAVGVPADVFEAAALLTSELATNSVKHSQSDWVDIEIILDSDRLHVAVGDQNDRTLRPRTPDVNGGWGLTLVAELADRWGVERQTVGKKIWIEFDLTP
jgi:transcriptional regulator with XRE-family HTH domain/anti-sigma regulatory factor (Ser/Thr protein kinase)